ncbi:MAG: phosphoribosylformylglycinamidine synthase subunit PurL [Alphaproteobacteria bacterium]
MTFRIEFIATTEDSRAAGIVARFRQNMALNDVALIDVYTVDKTFSDEQKEILTHALGDAVIREGFVKDADSFPEFEEYVDDYRDFNWAVEIGFLPGVTDNVGHTAAEIIVGSLDTSFAEGEAVYTSRIYLLKGDLSKADIAKIIGTISNPLIQSSAVKTMTEFMADQGMDLIVPRVALHGGQDGATEIDLDISDEALIAMGQKGIPEGDGFRGPLGLGLPEMKAIQSYFNGLGRKVKDLELETLAQTWSEHCKHTIFASEIDEVKDGLYKHYIKRSTQEIRKAKGKDDICVSVFVDNSGGIIFDEEWLITDKCETHNSPSALDPFGGAITGIVGVNRDCVGFGMGAKPIANRYGFCLADPTTKPNYYKDKKLTQAMLPPRFIMDGVIEGVNVGGNCSGIPTPQGFLYFDERFSGKPLVFAGTVGLIPRIINGKLGHEKTARPGDKIMMVGGRVGKDGIHGATFSSVVMDEGSPATAVQIGDPITQKKMSDAIVKEARDRGLYHAITDNGAGGLSSSVGEMAEGSGGFHVEIDKIPLKYPGMSPWEIWISESQERMTLAVPEVYVEELTELLAKRGAEATIIGEFTDSGRAVIVSKTGEKIMDMEMAFLHDGLPAKQLKTTFSPSNHIEPSFAEPISPIGTLKKMLGRLNICSKEFVATQYDHEVQGGSVLKPLQGKGRVMGEASAMRPVLSSKRTVILSHGLNPRQSDIDTYHMAANAIDMAVRNAIAAGGTLDHLALLDNFCWCSSDEPERLGQLKRAVQACYDYTVVYGTPLISGKDSMFNDFSGFKEDGTAIKVSAPPTLLVSGIGVVKDVAQIVSLDAKVAGDLVYLIGETKDELGASEYYASQNAIGNKVPKVDAIEFKKRYVAFSKATADHLVASAIAVNLGGLGIALAKKAIAGDLGLAVDLEKVLGAETELRSDTLLYSESAGRLLVTIAPQNKEAFEKAMTDLPVTEIGVVTTETHIKVARAGDMILDLSVADAGIAYKERLKDY